MKKSTKKTLMALAIILIFGISTIAFVATGIFNGAGNQQSQITPLEGYVIDGTINPNTEQAYIQGQFTFLRFYYKEKDALYDYVSQLPDITALPNGQPQLMVNRLETNETRAEIINLNGNVEIENLTDSGLFSALCQNLLFTPTDCLLAGAGVNKSS